MSTEYQRRLSKNEWAVLILIIVAGIVLRWANLEDRPLHHDESIHAMFSKNFLEHPDHHYYKNDPTYHGPFLYNILRTVFEVFGVTAASARGLIAFMGTIFLFIPLVFRRYFSNTALIALTAALALSPSLIYWARFLIHDFFAVSCVLAIVYGAVLAPSRLKPIIIFTALALHFTIKANAYVHLAIFFGYFVFEALFKAFRKREGEGPPAIVTRIASFIPANIGNILASAVIAVLIFSYFYTSGFRYIEGLTDNFWAIARGGIPQSVEYWFQQHQIERIPGPFNYHLYFLSWYELPFILAFFAHLVVFYVRSGRNILMAAMPIWAMGAVLAYYHFDNPVRDVWLWSQLKLINPMDVFCFLLLASHAVIVTVYHLSRKEEALAVSGYAFMATFVSYSFLAEKTPWLSMYPLLAGLPYLVLYFDSILSKSRGEVRASIVSLVLAVSFVALAFIFSVQGGADNNLQFALLGGVFFIIGMVEIVFRRRTTFNVKPVLLAAFILFSFRGAIITNFRLAADSSEVISQVHTTREFKTHALKVRRDLESRELIDEGRVLVTGVSVWPLTWYLRNVRGIHFVNEMPEDVSGFDYMFIDWKGRPGEDVIPGFRPINLRLRGWYVPDYRQMTLRKSLNYSINRKPWNQPGYQWVVLHVRKEETEE